jgi:hypothetical protein
VHLEAATNIKIELLDLQVQTKMTLRTIPHAQSQPNIRINSLDSAGASSCGSPGFSQRKSSSLAGGMRINSPEWKSDQKAPNCAECQTAFGLVTRRHHCRRCGEVFCDKCTKSRVAMPNAGYDKPVRCCQTCSELQAITEQMSSTSFSLITSGVPISPTSVHQFESRGEKEYTRDDKSEDSDRCRLSKDIRFRDSEEDEESYEGLQNNIGRHSCPAFIRRHTFSESIPIPSANSHNDDFIPPHLMVERQSLNQVGRPHCLKRSGASIPI